MAKPTVIFRAITLAMLLLQRCGAEILDAVEGIDSIPGFQQPAGLEYNGLGQTPVGQLLDRQFNPCGQGYGVCGKFPLVSRGATPRCDATLGLNSSWQGTLETAVHQVQIVAVQYAPPSMVPEYVELHWQRL